VVCISSGATEATCTATALPLGRPATCGCAVYVHALLAASVAAQKLNFVGDTGVADMSFNRPTNGTDLAMDLELQGCPTGDFSL
jgi:hypothetical protein